ncbi:MAG: T9SS type B sorting domain-containing protein, partial [Acinetobacter sp.]
TPITVANATASVNLFLYSEQAGAKAKVNDVIVPGTNQEYFLSGVNLTVGSNLLNIVVTAEDGVATRTYPLEVIRLPYVNVDLAALTINNGTYTPSFSPAVTTYNLSVRNSVTQLTITPVAATNTATISIAGALDVTPENPTATININSVGPPQVIRMTVRAADGVTTKRYTLNVTRLAPSAKLANLVLSSGTISPVFNPDGENFSATVAYGVANITLTPTAEDTNAVIKVNENVVTSGNASSVITLNPSSTIINVQVTSTSGATKDYNLTINRALANIATLTAIAIPGISIRETTGTSNFNYEASIDPDSTSVRIRLDATHPGATIKVNGTIVSSGTYSAPLPLIGAQTTINILVTAQDGVTTRTYAVIVKKTGSNIASLRAITIPGLSIKETTGTSNFNYEASIDQDSTSVKIKLDATHPGATIKVNGAMVNSGVYSEPLTLTGSQTIINILVTAQDGVTTRTYALTVKKAGSNIASLRAITIPGLSIRETTGTSNFNYESSIDPDSTSVKIKLDTTHPGATIKVNGTIVNSGTYTAPLPLTAAQTIINILVTAQDGVTTRTYALTVKKTGSNVATLTAIAMPGISIREATGSSNFNYEASIDPDSTSVRIRPDARHPGATIRVNGTIVASGTYSAPLPLTGAQTIINILVTAQDGVTTKTYAVTVKKTGSNIASLSAITIPGVSIREATGTSNFNYEASLGASTSSITLKLDAKHPGATIKVNGIIVSSGIYSAPIPINGNLTTINILVTAQDGITTRTYSIRLTKLGNGTSQSTLTINSLMVTESKASSLVKQEVLLHPALSPNGDGVNDFLQIDGIEDYPENKLTILNRAGVIIFNANGYNNSTKVFDGHANNGTMQLPGTYFYTLEFKDGQQTKRKTGYIIIKY